MPLLGMVCLSLTASKPFQLPPPELSVLPSDRLCHLPRLLHSRPLIQKLLPRNWNHQIPRLTPRHYNAQFILGGGAKIAPLVPEANHHSPHDIPYPERSRDGDFVDFAGADILLPDLCWEGIGEGMFAV